MNEKLSSKQLIIDVATKLFFSQGFEETTFSDVSKKVGISQPALYAHFRNKMDILKHGSLHAAIQGRAYIDSRLNPNDRAPLRLKSYLQANLDFFWNEKEFAHSIIALYYFASSSPELLELFLKIQDAAVERIETLLIQGKHEGAYAFKNTHSIARAVHSLLVGDCYKTIYSRSKTAANKIRIEHWESIELLLGI